MQIVFHNKNASSDILLEPNVLFSSKNIQFEQYYSDEYVMFAGSCIVSQ